MKKAPAKLKFQRIYFLPKIPARCFPQLGTPGPEVLSREQHTHRVLGSTEITGSACGAKSCPHGSTQP